MMPNRTRYFTAVTTAGFAVSVLLAGCGPQPQTAPADGSNVPVSTTADRTATPTFPPASTPAPVASTPSPKPAPGELKTFTFPDGHISFAYPAAWTVRTVRPPAGLPGVEATVADADGKDLLFLGNGVTAGCTGGPVSRQVLDHEPVRGMTAPDGTAAVFGFAVESRGGVDAYLMGLAGPRSLASGEGVASWCNLVPTANGGLFTRVIFDGAGFPNRGGAKAWMATDQYAQLKALLLSLNYA